MERWRGRVALVTGASGGIGAAICRELVRCGMMVIGCARNVNKIQDLASELRAEGFRGVLVPMKCDLTKEEEILSMFKKIKAEYKGVDVCINNAGLGHAEPLFTGQTCRWRNMLDVNVLALSICTREAYQSMKERGVDDGHIIHISSVCGHRVFPNSDLHFYTATKFAVMALTEGLRQELREAKSHIRITSISPGLVLTDFPSRFYDGDEQKTAASYSYYKALDAVDVANAAIYALSAPENVQIGDVLMQPVEEPL